MNAKEFWKKHVKTTITLGIPKDEAKAVEEGRTSERIHVRDVFIHRDEQKAYIGQVEQNVQNRWEAKTTEDDRHKHGFPNDYETPWEAAAELLRVYNQGWWEDWLKQKQAWSHAQ